MDPVPLTTLLASTAADAANTVNTGYIVGLTVAICIMILFSAYFSATETAFSSANKIRLRNMENNGNKRAARVLKQLDNYDKFINTVLIGNNVVNITATSLSGLLFAELIMNNPGLAATVSTIVMTIVVLIFGETVPKSVAKENAEAFALFSAPILRVIQLILLPLVWIFSLWRKLKKSKKKEVTVTEEELITIVEEAQKEGELDSHESQLIRSAIEFDDLDVYDIMVPRVNIIAIEDTADLQSVAEVFEEHGFSRLPVYHDTIDTIVGVLHEKDFFSIMRDNKTGFLSAVQSSICITRNMKISAALRTMQKAKVHMAIVVDEFGGTSGIVTMEDILEELVGEIYDEHDDEEILLKKLDDGSLVVSGTESLQELLDETGHSDDGDDFESSSVGGWVTEIMKKIPIVGEHFEYKNLKVTVTKANARRVIEVKAEVIPQEEDEEESKKTKDSADNESVEETN